MEVHNAVLANDIEALRKLFKKGNHRRSKSYLVAHDQEGLTPMATAIKHNRLDIMRVLLDAYKEAKLDINTRDKNGYTILHLAVQSNEKVLMTILQIEGIDVNVENADKNRPLHYFCQAYKSPNCSKPFKQMVDKGCDVNAQNLNGETALHKAIFNGSVRLLMVDLLLKSGADVNLVNSKGESALHYAVRLGRDDLVSVLLKAGADISIQGNKERKTAYQLAIAEERDDIADRIGMHQELLAWLHDMGLDACAPMIAKEELYLDVLVDADELVLSQLLSGMGVAAGHQIKFMKAVKALRENVLGSEFPSTQGIELYSEDQEVGGSGAIDDPNESQRSLRNRGYPHPPPSRKPNSFPNFFPTQHPSESLLFFPLPGENDVEHPLDGSDSPRSPSVTPPRTPRKYGSRENSPRDPLKNSTESCLAEEILSEIPPATPPPSEAPRSKRPLVSRTKTSRNLPAGPSNSRLDTDDLIASLNQTKTFTLPRSSSPSSLRSSSHAHPPHTSSSPTSVLRSSNSSFIPSNPPVNPSPVNSPPVTSPPTPPPHITPTFQIIPTPSVTSPPPVTSPSVIPPPVTAPVALPPGPSPPSSPRHAPADSPPFDSHHVNPSTASPPAYPPPLYLTNFQPSINSTIDDLDYENFTTELSSIPPTKTPEEPPATPIPPPADEPSTISMDPNPVPTNTTATATATDSQSVPPIISEDLPATSADQKLSPLSVDTSSTTSIDQPPTISVDQHPTISIDAPPTFSPDQHPVTSSEDIHPSITVDQPPPTITVDAISVDSPPPATSSDANPTMLLDPPSPGTLSPPNSLDAPTSPNSLSPNAHLAPNKSVSYRGFVRGISVNNNSSSNLMNNNQQGNPSPRRRARASIIRDLTDSLSHLKHSGPAPLLLHNDLEFTGKLGAGSSGKVYKGLYKGTMVAIKVLKNLTPSEEDESIIEFRKEFEIMSAIHIPHSVYFYGAVLEPKICMVMEYCSRGSLYHVLNSPKYNVGWDQLFHYAVEATTGIKELHSLDPQIVHRDIKSLNFLVNESFEVKVCDFGLSRFNTGSNLSTLQRLRGTYAYCAPEVYNTEFFSTKSDVYSIGIVFWELVTRCIRGHYERPYGEYKNIMFDFQIIIQAAKMGLRPTIPETCPEGWKKLILSCIDGSAEKRPTCEEILVILADLCAEWSANKAEWDAVVAPKASKASKASKAAKAAIE